MYSAIDESWLVSSWPSYKEMLLCLFLYVHVWTLSVMCVPTRGIVRSWGRYIFNFTRHHQTVFQGAFTSEYFPPAVFENSSCDISIPLPCPISWWLKTLLTCFSKALQAVKSDAFPFQEPEAFHQGRGNYIWADYENYGSSRSSKQT